MKGNLCSIYLPKQNTLYIVVSVFLIGEAFTDFSLTPVGQRLEPIKAPLSAFRCMPGGCRMWMSLSPSWTEAMWMPSAVSGPTQASGSATAAAASTSCWTRQSSEYHQYVLVSLSVSVFFSLCLSRRGIDLLSVCPRCNIC